MPFASLVSGRSCRRRGISACRLHPVFQAGAAAAEASTHPGPKPDPTRPEAGPARARPDPTRALPDQAGFDMPIRCSACIGCCWQEPWRRGIITCRLHPLFLAGAAGGEVSPQAVSINSFWQELPAASLRCMALAASVSGRSCRRRGFNACRLHPLFWQEFAGGRASTHGACIQCCW